MALKILITNDDSISSPVLLPLIKWASKIGEVTTVVPKYEQSGKSHSIEIHKAFEVQKVEIEPGIEVYTVDSAPADCDRYAVLGLGMNFNLVISGINRGLNLGIDILYSGTAAGLFEAGCCGIPAVAISTEPDSFDDALANLDNIYNFFIEHKLLEKHSLYNINIPIGNKGIRITRQGGRYYSDDFAHEENNMVRPLGKPVFQPSGTDELDTDAVLHHKYVSISPMTVIRTDNRVFEELKFLNK
jgi:5'-nucleotidase